MPPGPKFRDDIKTYQLVSKHLIEQAYECAKALEVMFIAPLKEEYSA